MNQPDENAFPPPLPSEAWPPRPPGDEPRRIASSELLRGQREVLIEHQGLVYRLSLTRAGKLILHK